MNFNLPKDNKNNIKKKGSLRMGLNARGNVFGGDSSSEEEDNAAAGSTSRVNQALVREQELLRKRAETAAVVAAAPEQKEIYDYDAAYDSFHNSNQESNQQKEKDQKSSRYIGELLKAAKQRQYERDVVYERKIAKEQAEEEQRNADFQLKDKFVTAAYKRKLEERRLWQEQEEKKRKAEEADDVTKKKGDMAMASFYGNLNRNVAMGGATAESDELEKLEQVPTDRTNQRLHDDDVGGNPKNGLSFLEGFEKAGDENEKQSPKEEVGVSAQESNGGLTIREIREKKVSEARLRYFQRHGIPAVN